MYSLSFTSRLLDFSASEAPEISSSDLVTIWMNSKLAISFPPSSFCCCSAVASRRRRHRGQRRPRAVGAGHGVAAGRHWRSRRPADRRWTVSLAAPRVQSSPLVPPHPRRRLAPETPDAVWSEPRAPPPASWSATWQRSAAAGATRRISQRARRLLSRPESCNTCSLVIFWNDATMRA